MYPHENMVGIDNHPHLKRESRSAAFITICLTTFYSEQMLDN